MKLSSLLMTILLLLCVVLGIAWVLPESENAAGVAHPRVETMMHGGLGDKRHADMTYWLGCAYGTLLIALFTGCMALGARKEGRLGGLKWPFVFGFLIWVAVFAALMISYRSYMTEAEHAQILFLPIPTAWMVYGLWSAPLFFTLLYIVIFNSWTMRPEDEERFAKLVEARRAREGR